MASHLLNEIALAHPPLRTLQLRTTGILSDASSFYTSLDRLNELHGHTGCVNALSWSADGQILLSGGDDCTIRFWRLDENSREPSSFPFTTRATVRTGHTGNIFNAQFLSYNSSALATCARDATVRVFDTNRISSGDPALKKASHRGMWDDVSMSTACLRVFRCHRDAVKRIVSEESDSHFLTVSEDGSVRQHDLRVPHTCERHKECGSPLVKVDHGLYTMSMSPLAPYYFVVAGESAYAYMHDRRHCGRSLYREWGVEHRKGPLTTHVRTFGRRRRGPSEPAMNTHITGAKLSHCNPHELLLNYSGDGVYLFNTRDDPNEQDEGRPRASTPTLPSGSKGRGDSSGSDTESEVGRDDPLVYPRMRFAGACNVETVKDVNFLGRTDQYVTSGSDDGNFFIWSKQTGTVINVLEGDGSVVNVVESNPVLQCMAVSGIDTSVKIFGKGREVSTFGRLASLEEIMEENKRRPSRLVQLQRASILALLARHRTAGAEDEEEEECVHQ